MNLRIPTLSNYINKFYIPSVGSLKPAARNLILVVATFFFGFEVIYTAWLGDDSFFTIRSIINFIDGYGPVFNIGERVQAYTHPLWFFLLTPIIAFTDSIYISIFLTSLCLSLGTLWVLIRLLSSSLSGCLIAVIALLFSKAFVDYSTSGLENPLSHFLITLTAFFAIKFDKKPTNLNLFYFCLTGGLLYLNRQDLILSILPLTLYTIYKSRKLKLLPARMLMLGLIPVILWLIVSLFYYGFPFPNTAYAKLGNGIDHLELLAQARFYFLNSLLYDPITLITILLGLIVAIYGPALNKAIALGVVFYLIYIAWVGGDFMSGRFFSSPLLFSCIVIARTAFTKRSMAIIFIPWVFLALYNAPSIFSETTAAPMIPPFHEGIADERRIHVDRYGIKQFINHEPAFLISPRRFLDQEMRVEVMCHGSTSLKQGPSLHVIDDCGLADPLLSRIPARQDREWRIGHFYRTTPVGYIESIQSGINQITDPATHNYYDQLKLITQAPLFSWKRMKAIFEMNFNLVEKPNPYFYQYGVSLMPSPKNQEIVFGGGELTARHFGWQSSEDWGVWTDGERARLTLLIPDKGANSLKLNLRALIGGPVSCQKVIIQLKSQVVADVCLSQIDDNLVAINLPTSARTPNHPLTLDLYLQNASSPKSLGLSASDDRKLAIGIKTALFQ